VLKTTRAMSDRHEDHLADLFAGRKTRGSGNQSRDQMDGKQEYRSQRYVFAWDGKATLGKSIGVTLEMWRKAKEQAHWAIPVLPLRWYANERLTDVAADLVADLQRDANRYHATKDCLDGNHNMEVPLQPDGTPYRDSFPHCTGCGKASYELPGGCCAR
jgi:hypothetical protein